MTFSIVFFFFVVLGVEPCVSHMLSKLTTTWAISLAYLSPPTSTFFLTHKTIVNIYVELLITEF